MKRVTFSENLEQTFFIEKNCPSRNGSDWIRCSLDRQRFYDRVKNIDLLHGYIFSDFHRLNMYHYIMSKQ
jgi:hypothetical protein